MQKQIEERLELSGIIDYAMRDWDDYLEECHQSEIQPIDDFEDFIADSILHAGYRKQSEVIDEFVKKLKQAPIKCKLPLLGLPTKEEIEEYFDDIMLQVGDAIDSIAKEMKGE